MFVNHYTSHVFRIFSGCSASISESGVGLRSRVNPSAIEEGPVTGTMDLVLGRISVIGVSTCRFDHGSTDFQFGALHEP